MMKKLIYVLAVLGMGGISFGVNVYTGFNSAEDGAAYTLGNSNGQGSAVNDWAGAL